MSDERRRSARIAVEIACAVRGPQAELDGVIRDISAVGARLVVPQPVADDLEAVDLDVGAGDGHEALTVRGRVMYHRDRPEGIVLGLQFIDLDAETHRQLRAFLEAVLSGQGGGNRAHPRVAQRIDVTCRTKDKARAVLEDVSKGGLRLRVPDGIAPGEAIEVSITIGKLGQPLSLRGEVIRTKRASDDNVYAAVKLDALSDEDSALLGKLMSALVGG